MMVTLHCALYSTNRILNLQAGLVKDLRHIGISWPEKLALWSAPSHFIFDDTKLDVTYLSQYPTWTTLTA